MQSSELKFTQGIYGFQVERTDMTKIDSRKTLEITLRRKEFHCPFCFSGCVSVYAEKAREIQGMPIGRADLIFRVTVHRLYCPDCGRRCYEQFEFLRTPESRLTRQLERTIVELRREMSIKAVSEHYNVPWETIKNVEKAMLGRMYARVLLKDVRHIGIDEIYLFKTAKSGEKYVTVVRDLETGAVLEVARGKGVAALKSFERRIRKFKRKIKSVCMDMSNSYASWVSEHLPKAQIIFDHFHVIKAMNEKLDAIRRSVIRDLDDEARKSLKNMRMCFLKNREDLDADSLAKLDKARESFQPLSEAYLLKERLRGIYANAADELEAMVMLEEWIRMAEQTEVCQLRSMAKCIRNHMEGILAFWIYDRATNAKSEGFNNKIRWLVSQAYGYKDYEYLRLKIFHLPKTNIRKAI
jgi:transposase